MISPYKLYPEILDAGKEGWYIVKFDFSADDYHFLWAEDLKFHEAWIGMPIDEFIEKFYYKTKEEAERTLRRWEATHA